MVAGLRVALFSGNYNYQTDGANKALNMLVKYLESQDIEVLVFSPTSRNPAFEPEGTLVSVPSLPIPGRGEYRIGAGLSQKIKRQIRAFNPSLFHLSAPDLLGHSALKLSEALSIPAVASFHTRFDTYFQYYGLSFLQPFCRRMMTRFYNRCEQVYVPSQSVGQALVDDGILGDNLRYWSRGIDCNKFNPAHRDLGWRRHIGIADTDIALGFFGRLVKEKGIDDYITLFTNLQKRDLPVKALIVGDGPEFNAVRKRLPQAVLTGHLDGKNLARAYASADIFINPSRTETFGNVTLEAMTSQVVTVCRNATGSADLVKHGHSGWLIDGKEHEDWLNKTETLCRDENLRNRMSINARRYGETFNWNNIMSNLVTQYLEVSGSRPHAKLLAAE